MLERTLLLKEVNFTFNIYIYMWKYIVASVNNLSQYLTSQVNIPRDARDENLLKNS